MNEIIQKLNISDYVLEIDGKDIYNCILKYFINTKMQVYYNDGTVEEIYNPIISFEIQGFDLEENEAWISFEINIGLDELNTFSDIPRNIIDKVSCSEAFAKIPTNDNSGFLDFEMPTNKCEDIYKNLSSLWVSKLDKNIFMFKICVPSEKIFSYFKVDFNKR